MISIKQVISQIEAFATAHKQIKKFGFEFFEQMPNLATVDEKFPYMFVTPVGATTYENMVEFDLDVYCVDRLQKDRTNMKFTVSDTQLILTDLSVWLEDGEHDIDVERIYPQTPINNALLDYVDGWVMKIKVQVDRVELCEVPMDGITPPDFSCEDATYTITDSDLNVLYSGSISSGGNLDQPIQDSTVTNSDATYSASILAEGSLVLPDITVTDSDGSSSSFPSAKNVTCTPSPNTSLEVNGTPEGSVVAGSTVDIQLSDSGGTVTPTSVTQVGNDLQIVLPDGGGVVDPDAQTFITTASISDSTQQEAIDMFVKDLKFFSLWDKMKAVYPMVGGNSTAHSYNLRNVAQYQLSFFGGWVHSATGAAPNGTNAYADTGLNISTQYTDYLASHHLSIYSLTDFPVGNGWAIGVGNTATGNPLFGLAVRRETSKDNIYDFGNTSNNGRLTFTPIIISPPSQVTESFTNSAKNFYIGSALSTTSREFRKSSKQLGTSALTVLGTPSNANIWLGAMNPFPTGAVLYNGAEMGCITIGDGLTTQEIQILYGIVHTYNARLNRAV